MQFSNNYLKDIGAGIKAKRYRQIAAVLAKYGFADLITELGFARYLPVGRRLPKTPSERLETRGYNLRLALQELGPTFIKIGQFLSTRSDIIPYEIVKHLEKLLDEIPPFPAEQAMAIVERELGEPAGEIFEWFDPEPLASASLSQVHQALTHDDELVAVKIQRPMIEDLIDQDIQIIYSIASFLTKRTELSKSYDFIGLAVDFGNQIHEELDFTIEANSVEILAHNLEEFELIKLPQVYKEFSTKKVLTLEKINGFKVTDSEALEALDPHVRQELAVQLLQAYLKQILEDGFFHADPHAGNIFILPEGRLALIDLGIIGKLDSETRGNVTKLLLSFVEQETVEVTDIAIRMSTMESHPVLGRIRQDIGRLITKYYNRPAHEINIGQAVIDIMQIVMKHNLKMPSSLGMFGKSLLYVEQISRQLDPGINYITFISSQSQRLLYERIRSVFAAPRVIRNLLDMNDLLFDIPPKAHIVLQKLAEDNISVRFDHVGLDDLEDTLDSVANRMSFAIIVAALVIGSALILRVETGPFYFGLPIIGIIGFVVASLLGLYLVYTIIRSRGKM